MLHVTRIAAALVLASLLLAASSYADELYEFGFKQGLCSISMPSSEAPEVIEYTDTDGGEFSWYIDAGGAVIYLYGMTHTTGDDDWYYSFEHCDEIERGPDRTLRINKEYWKYCISDVVLKLDDLELTYVDLWKTRKGLKHDFRFACERYEDKEELLEIIEGHMETLEWWN